MKIRKSESSKTIIAEVDEENAVAPLMAGDAVMFDALAPREVGKIGIVKRNGAERIKRIETSDLKEKSVLGVAFKVIRDL